MWVYEGHMGSIYARDEHLSYDDLYCEECGDNDWEIGRAETREEAKKLLEDVGYYELYGAEYCEAFLDRTFGKIRKRRGRHENTN